MPELSDKYSSLSYTPAREDSLPVATEVAEGTFRIGGDRQEKSEGEPMLTDAALPAVDEMARSSNRYLWKV